MNSKVVKVGDFSFLESKNEISYLSDMYQVIEKHSEIDYWLLLKNFNEESFMLSHQKWIVDLCHLCDPGHSGCSFSLCLRNMEYIAKHGWVNYINFRQTSSDNNQ